MDTELIYNPKSGRRIKINSSRYNELLRTSFTLENGALKPRILDNYVYSEVKNIYIKKEGKLYLEIIKSYEVKENKFVQRITDTIFAPNGKKIDKDSRAYNNLIDLGYSYNDETNKLQYPIEVEILELKNSDILPGLIEKININPDKYHHVFIEGDDGYSATLDLPKSKKEIRAWWYETVLYENQSIYAVHLYPNIRDIHFGPSYNGAKNCVISELENHFKKKDYPYDFSKFYKKYSDGVFEKDFKELTTKLKMRIVVNVGNKEYVFGRTKNNKSQLNLFYRNNHMTASKVQFKEKENVFVHDVDQILTTLELKDITNMIKGKEKTFAIETEDKIYRLKIDNGVDLELNDVFSSTTYYTKKFLENNPELKCISKIHNNLDAIKTIIQNGINMSNVNQPHRKNSKELIQPHRKNSKELIQPHRKNSKELIQPHRKNSKELIQSMVCIDLKRAYSNFENFPEYTGFPTDLSQCVSCENMESKDIINIINTCEGYALSDLPDIFSTVDDPYDSDEESNDTDEESSYTGNSSNITRWSSFPYIRHRLKLGHDLNITHLMISLNICKKLNLDIFEKTSKRTLHKVFGKLINTKKNSSFTTIDPVVGLSYGGNLTYSNSCDKLFLCNHYSDFICGTYYFPHITGYVQQYTEIQIEKLYLSLQSKNIHVSKIWVDGININKSNLSKININTDLWAIKDITLSKESFTCKQTYITGIEPTKYAESFNPLLMNLSTKRKYVLMGEAGTGKTYNVKKLYNQLNNSIILLPKHNLKQDYPGMQTETIHSYVEKHMRQYETLILDEFAMISQELLDRIEDIDKKTIILVGDFGQLKCVNGVPINISEFELITLKKNYRQKDKNFQELLRKTRESGDIMWINQRISPLKAVMNKFIILSATHAEIDKINKIGDDLNPNPSQGGYKVDTPIRFYQTRKDYNAGDMGTITDIDEKNKEITISINEDKCVKIPCTSFTNTKTLIVKKAYSITYHAVQGKTITQNIAINLIRLFDKNMKYVGVSRATEQGNIYILEKD
jgi:hypothetical protein